MLEYDDPKIINVGTGQDVTIRELAEEVAGAGGYSGRLSFDTSNPDGTPRKLLDVIRVRTIGWTAKVDLRDGIAATYNRYVQHHRPT